MSGNVVACVEPAVAEMSSRFLYFLFVLFSHVPCHCRLTLTQVQSACTERNGQVWNSSGSVLDNSTPAFRYVELFCFSGSRRGYV